MPSRRQALGVGLAMAFVALIATPATAFNSAETETVPGEVIVHFKRDVAKGDALAGSATKATRDLSLPRTKLIKVAGSAKRAIAQLESDPAVAWAEPNYVRERRAVPNDPRFRDLWGALNIGSPSAWNVTTGTREVTLAVADDGVDADHPDLAANIWRNPGESGGGREQNGVDDDRNGYVDDWRGWDFASTDNAPQPELEYGELAYHGTHVAGILGAVGNNRIGVTGVNWSVSIMPLRIFNRSGSTTSAKIAKAFDYAGENGARAVNASWGGGGDSKVERSAIGRWPRTLYVAAAPNRSIDIDVKGDYPCDYQKANIICVTASNSRQLLAGFAGYGNRNVDIAAPGVNIWSTVPGGYEEVSGTSMATPQVTGAVGLVAAANPDLSAAQTREILLSSADRLPSLLGKLVSGRLDVAEAVSRAVDTQPQPQPSPRPKTRLTKGPASGASAGARPRFRFHSNVGDAKFQCKTDRKRWRKCRSPYRPKHLKRGRFHTFRVRAIAPGGRRDKTPAKARFYVR